MFPSIFSLPENEVHDERNTDLERERETRQSHDGWRTVRRADHVFRTWREGNNTDCQRKIVFDFVQMRTFVALFERWL